MRFLCISDVHGDAKALRAVLQHGKERGYNQLLIAGDLLFPGEEPLETWKLIVEEHALCVQGLSDRALALIDPDSLTATSELEAARLARLHEVHEALGDLIVARLGKLPETARLPLENGLEMLVVHGSPADPTESMSVEMDDEELNALIGDDPADLVVCGGSHVPFDRLVGDVRIINVGSVGERVTPGYAYSTLIETLPIGVEVQQYAIEV